MGAIQSVTVGERVVDLYTFHGEVMDEKKWATTQVSGGGGGGYVHQGSGYVSNAPITSTTTTHDQFFVRGEDGQEVAVETANAKLAVRKGHRVSLLWGIVKGNERGPYIAIYNHTTSDLTVLDASIVSLAVPPPSMLFKIGVVAGIVGICASGLGIILLVVLFYRAKKRKKELVGALRPAVDLAISQIKNQ